MRIRPLGPYNYRLLFVVTMSLGRQMNGSLKMQAMKRSF